MIDPTKYIVTETDMIDDVDLDIEVVRLKDGRRLAEQLARETLAEVRRRNPVIASDT